MCCRYLFRTSVYLYGYLTYVIFPVSTLVWLPSQFKHSFCSLTFKATISCLFWRNPTVRISVIYTVLYCVATKLASHTIYHRRLLKQRSTCRLTHSAKYVTICPPAPSILRFVCPAELIDALLGSKLQCASHFASNQAVHCSALLREAS